MTNPLPVDSLMTLSKSQLIAMVKRGMLSFNMTTSIDAPNRDELPEYQKFKHLAGKAIHISAGARKYKIYQQTLSRWVKRGIIKTLGMDKNKVLIDEQDLAYCAWVQHQRPGTGKWLFDKDGLPYIPENSKD